MIMPYLIKRMVCCGYYQYSKRFSKCTINLYHKEALSTLFAWYRDSLMQSNAGNCPLLDSTNASVFMKTITLI